ncbi:MAG: thiol peroxidase [Candidatus Omnitrophica bacterium]|jgi:thiol peroxidase|nr:thiol peroxidase [Candidatus Omnitrophota bacterium]
MERQTKFQGAPLTLVGRNLKLNTDAPDFRVISTDLKEVTLKDFKDKIKIITSFPSSDTPVCDLQVKEFNKKAVAFSKDIVVLGISKDLPFAQKRFCDLNNITNVVTLSDYRFSSFGINYGLLIKELNLLARSVSIVDKTNVIRYMQIAPEVTSQLNYESVLTALNDVVSNPQQKRMKHDLPIVSLAKRVQVA